MLRLLLALVVVGGCNADDSTLTAIFNSLDAMVSTLEAQKTLNSHLNIAVGVNAAVDLIVSGTDLMKALGVGPPAKAHLHGSMSDLDALAESFAHSFGTGTGSERTFADAAEYKRIVKVASALETKEFFTGGNAALIGQHLVETAGEKSRDVTLVASVGPVLKGLLHKDIKVLKSSLAEDDEVHLIVEFKLGETWGSFTAPRANRFIFSFDRTNAEMKPLEAYPAAIAETQPDVVVFSGIHMVEGEDQLMGKAGENQHPFRRHRVWDTADFFAATHAKHAIHLELASLANDEFVADIVASMIGPTDSLGLNEQELKLLALAAKGPHQDVLQGSFENPTVEVIADLVHWLLDTFGEQAGARLSRVHFHTLGFHLMGAYKGRWGDIKAATAWGAVSCSQRACRVTERHRAGAALEGMVTHRMPERFSLTGINEVSNDDNSLGPRKFDPENAVVYWERGDMEFALAPVLVCTPPEKTVGLGDSISAAGLEMHRMLHEHSVKHGDL